MQDPCLFWRWRQNKKSHPEFSIPKGGASQEKQSCAVVFPFSTAEEQEAFFRAEIRTNEGAASEIPVRTMNGRCRQGPSKGSWALSACKKKKKELARKKYMRSEVVKHTQHAIRKDTFQTKNMRQGDAFHFRESPGKSKLSDGEGEPCLCLYAQNPHKNDHQT